MPSSRHVLIIVTVCMLIAHCHISTRQRLQRVRNRAARFVLSAPPRNSSRPLLQQLHWLPIEARVSYKLLFDVPGRPQSCTVIYYRTLRTMS